MTPPHFCFLVEKSFLAVLHPIFLCEHAEFVHLQHWFECLSYSECQPSSCYSFLKLIGKKMLEDGDAESHLWRVHRSNSISSTDNGLIQLVIFWRHFSSSQRQNPISPCCMELWSAGANTIDPHCALTTASFTQTCSFSFLFLRPDFSWNSAASTIICISK